MGRGVGSVCKGGCESTLVMAVVVQMQVVVVACAVGRVEFFSACSCTRQALPRPTGCAPSCFLVCPLA